MTNRKNTKKALLTSVLALILCFSMLIGTTFAWFTDSVSSGVNQIIAGNLDVDVYTADGNSIQDQASLFDEIELWEPGVVAYENLTVANLGTLALKYQLYVNFDNENTLNGLGLSDVLQVAVVENGVATGLTREQLIESIDEDAWSSMASFMLNGELEAGAENDVYGIVIWWEPSDKDNNWNVQNGKTTSDGEPLHIDLGVKLVATQLMSEEDSFGKDYDEGAYLPTVYTAAELASALENGESVKLGADIKTETRIEVPVDAKVTIDMNGYDLSTDGSIAIYSKGDLTITGEGEISSVSGYAIRVQSGSLVIDSADITVSSQFGAVSIFNGAEVTINGGNYSNTGYNGNTSHTIYLGGYGTLNINGGTFDSGYSNGGIDTICGYGWSNDAGEKAVININGGTFYPSELNSSYYFISNYDSNWTEININGGCYSTYDPAKLSGVNCKGVSTYNEETGLYEVAPYQVGNAEALAEALTAGKNVALIDDIETDGRIEIPADAAVVIDLNGHSITSDSSIVLYSMGDLTITGEGSVESTYSNYAIRVQSGSMVIDSADINVKGSFGAISIFNGAEVTINGGNYYADGMNGMTSHTVYVKDSTLTVNGGTFDSGYSNEGIGTITGSNSTVILNDGIFYASELGKNFYMTNTVINGGSYEYDPTTLAASKNIVVNGTVIYNENTGLYDVTSN